MTEPHRVSMVCPICELRLEKHIFISSLQVEVSRIPVDDNHPAVIEAEADCERVMRRHILDGHKHEQR